MDKKENLSWESDIGGDKKYDFTRLNSICFVIEYVDTDIDTLLRNKIIVTENVILKIIYSSLCSLSFLHEANVLHRDIKSANILIFSDCNTKICDFGLSRTLP